MTKQSTCGHDFRVFRVVEFKTGMLSIPRAKRNYSVFKERKAGERRVSDASFDELIIGIRRAICKEIERCLYFSVPKMELIQFRVLSFGFQVSSWKSGRWSVVVRRLRASGSVSIPARSTGLRAGSSRRRKNRAPRAGSHSNVMQALWRNSVDL